MKEKKIVNTTDLLINKKKRGGMKKKRDLGGKRGGARDKVKSDSAHTGAHRTRKVAGKTK